MVGRVLTEPFAALLDSPRGADVVDIRERPETTPDHGVETDGDAADRCRPGNVFRTTFADVRGGLGGEYEEPIRSRNHRMGLE